MREALIIPSYGFITPDETRPGGKGTKARIEKARALIREGIVARNCIVPFPQKSTPHGTERDLIGNVPLGKNIATYVRSLPEFAEATIIDTPLSTGTFDDAVASIKVIYLDENAGDDPVHVHFVSDWSQLGRLWIVWNVAIAHENAVRHWQASFHLVPDFRTARDVWSHEPPAYAKCLWRSLHRRFLL